jgi:hypothetical protein
VLVPSVSVVLVPVVVPVLVSFVVLVLGLVLVLVLVPVLVLVLASAVVPVLVESGGSTVVVGPGSLVVVASLVEVVPAEASESVCPVGAPQAGAAASAPVRVRDARELCEIRMNRVRPKAMTLHRPIGRRNDPAGRQVGAPTDTPARWCRRGRARS